MITRWHSGETDDELKEVCARGGTALMWERFCFLGRKVAVTQKALAACVRGFEAAQSACIIAAQCPSALPLCAVISTTSWVLSRPAIVRGRLKALFSPFDVVPFPYPVRRMASCGTRCSLASGCTTRASTRATAPLWSTSSSAARFRRAPSLCFDALKPHVAISCWLGWQLVGVGVGKEGCQLRIRRLS